MVSTFGDRLVMLRGKRPRREVAEQLGVSQSTISSWETERTQPGVADLAKLVRFFNVSADYLVGVTEIPLPPRVDGNAPSSVPKGAAHANTPKNGADASETLVEANAALSAANRELVFLLSKKL